MRWPALGKKILAASVIASTVAAFALNSCWVSIALPAPDLGASTGGSTTGAGGALAAGSAGRAGDNSGNCLSDEKSCNGDCVKKSNPLTGCAENSCDPCNPHGQATCKAGACVVESCDSEWADCDALAWNGCEHHFGVSPVSTAARLSPLSVSAVSSPPPPTEWEALALIPIAAKCAECVADMPGGRKEPPVTNLGETPKSTDISAYFRVGHGEAGLYLEALVFDNDLQAGSAAAPRLPLEQDAVLVLFDGKNDGGTYGPDDHYLALGLDKTFKEQDRQIATDDVNLVSERLGPSCYRLQARLKWSYLAGLVGASSARPAPGTGLGFSVMVSDVDSNLLGKPERQSLLFWQTAGTEYAFKTDSFSELTLR